MTPKSPKLGQFTRNLTPTSANIAQLEAKIGQDGLQEPPTGPPWTPKSTKNVVGLFDFILGAFLQRSLPRRRKMPKIAPQRASRWLSWLPLGPSWRLLAARSRQLGPNLAHLGAFWAHLGSILALPGPPKNGQSGFQTQLGAKMAQDRRRDRPQTLQTPRKSIFLRFGGQFFMFFAWCSAARLSKRCRR